MLIHYYCGCRKSSEFYISKVEGSATNWLEHQRCTLLRSSHWQFRNRCSQPRNQMRLLLQPQHYLSHYWPVSIPNSIFSAMKILYFRKLLLLNMISRSNCSLYVRSWAIFWSFVRSEINQRCRRIYALDVVGPLPDELWNLTFLTNLYVSFAILFPFSYTSFSW